MTELATLLIFLQQHGIVSTIIGLLCVNGVIFYQTYPVYARFQLATYRRTLPDIWATGDSYSNDMAGVEMLFAIDPLMPLSLGARLTCLRLTILMTAVAMGAYIAGFDFRIG